MENRRVIRRVLTFGLAVAVQGGACVRPSCTRTSTRITTTIIQRRSTRTSPHAPSPVHNGVAVDEADRDRAIYLQVFVAVETSPFQTPVLRRATLYLGAPPHRSPAHLTVVTHGHDPPLVAALDSRPPPLFLS